MVAYIKTMIKYPVAGDKYKLDTIRFYRKFPPPSFLKSQHKREIQWPDVSNPNGLMRTKIRDKLRC